MLFSIPKITSLPDHRAVRIDALMNVEKPSEPLNEKHRPLWRVALQSFLFFSSWMIACMAVIKLHSAGQPISLVIISGIIPGVIFAAFVHRHQS